MFVRLWSLALIATASASGVACGQTAASRSSDAAASAASPPAAPAHRRWGYLGPQGVPDSIAILPPPPAAGSKAEALDRAIYVQTRQLQGGDRWTLAAEDAVSTPAAVETAFACALGVQLTPAATPALTRLMSRVGADAGSIVNPPKDHYARRRPYLDNNLPICVPRSAELAASPSYPSGHTTFGWAAGLILAEIEPERATPILARARAYGESRVVCGVHYASDVEAGRTNGAALVAALHANAEFRTDLDAARLELTRLRAAGPALNGAACRVSDEAAAHTPWAQ